MPRLGALRAAAGLAVVLVLGINQGTFALWNDSGTVPGGPIHTGMLDLQVDGQDAIGNFAPLDLPSLVPGQTAATVLTIRNQGNVDLTWTASTSGTHAANGLLGALRLLVTAASTTNGATCGGAALPGSSTSAGGTLIGTPRSLAPGESELVCVQVGLPAGASSSLAGAATDLTVAVQASRGGWSDTVNVGGVGLAAVPLTPPTVTCSGVLGLNLTMSWSAVPGAKEYRVVSLLGVLLDTITAGGTLQTTVGALTGVTIKTVYGNEWVSAGAGC